MANEKDEIFQRPHSFLQAVEMKKGVRTMVFQEANLFHIAKHRTRPNEPKLSNIPGEVQFDQLCGGKWKPLDPEIPLKVWKNGRDSTNQFSAIPLWDIITWVFSPHGWDAIIYTKTERDLQHIIRNSTVKSIDGSTHTNKLGPASYNRDLQQQAQKFCHDTAANPKPGYASWFCIKLLGLFHLQMKNLKILTVEYQMVM